MYECVVQYTQHRNLVQNVNISRLPLVLCAQHVQAKEKKSAWKDKSKLIKLSYCARIHIKLKLQNCAITLHTVHRAHSSYH